MAPRIRLLVEVTEEDHNGDIIVRHCSHSELANLPDGDPDSPEALISNYCRWAYRGFEVARNGPFGLVDPKGHWLYDTASLRLLVLRSPRLEAMQAFYRSLGIPLVPEQHGTGPVHYVGHLGALVLEISPLKDGAEPDTTRLGLAVFDLERRLRRCEIRGRRSSVRLRRPSGAPEQW